MKIGFIAWNPFQIVQFANLFPLFINSDILIIDKGDNLQHFNKKWLNKFGIRFEYIRQSMISRIDGVYDAIFFQSPFPLMERITKTRLISLQYGLAKERHNYGEWRSLADMNLMYGPYSVKRVEHFSPSFSVGNPKFDNWTSYAGSQQRQLIFNRLKINKEKLVILYMPTWGELGSFDRLSHKLATLTTRYNIIVKMHHNNDSRFPAWKSNATKLGFGLIFDGAADQLELLSIADLVVSDFSGAIFDAIYAQVPVLLFQENTEEKIGVQKFDCTSLEFARRDEIGYVCNNLEDFEQSVIEALNMSHSLVRQADLLRTDLFQETPTSLSCSAEIHAKTTSLLNNEIPALSASQMYVRESVRSLRTIQKELRAANKKLTKRRRFLIF
ncbi:CDP-glycerol glycerophosphotransferase family protein [Pusillimonas sp. ANT_WB101]|uniref:CDP-glycerol glycerophosphotransferase family protein n=1 Tax=Pusillimonas sp. ANT_WB101 TaxID=2597356 RepID=UPI0011EDC556|nr:CDP-glycerol glycerophosphotransferase family protein [Pusillimonas sp. ANT_WB101]KAA0911375.1 hypothetical protein FQ179_05940 [Pusillimonas sp. ANT_WB101]